MPWPSICSPKSTTHAGLAVPHSASAQALFAFAKTKRLVSKFAVRALWGPCSLEANHTDLYWYGVHGVEILYTAMGTGCQSVTRIHTDGVDMVVGVWEGGRVGSFRGIRDGKADYGLVAFGQKQIELGGKYEGYAPLVYRIADFFAGGQPPVDTAETIELFTFMQAADVSKERGGAPVKLAEVRAEALAQAKAKLAQLDP